ncbi:MAG: hypothetical protein E7378_02560 [Clostridiales bacterium]|nr:hypothetical protein [Clostridiales bacterium]
MSNNNTPFDYTQTLKRGFIYLLIAAPFMAVLCVVLTIVNCPFVLNLIITVALGGAIVLLCMYIRSKKKEKKDKENQGKKKFDPFRD